MSSGAQLNIYEYNDYRKFLDDYYVEKKRVNPGYSHRVFAKMAGLSSPSHLLMIIRGQRNLSQKTIPKFVDGLGLKQKEARFFELLVLFAQSDELPQKAGYFAEIMSLKATSKKLHPLEREKYEFLSKWYVVAIYVMLDLKDFQSDPSWIALRLGNRITSLQATDSLEVLVRLGLVAESEGVYRQAAGAISVSDDTREAAVFTYHRSMLRLAEDALRLLPVHEREFNGLTIAIPNAKLGEVKDKIRAFRKELNQIASSYSGADEVYQLNIQLFPVSKREGR